MCTKSFSRIIVAFLLLYCLPIRGVQAQVVTTANTAISFGTVELADTHNGSVQLATNGDVQTTGSGLSAFDNGNAGSIKITEPDTGIIDIKCASSGELVDAVAPSLTLDNIEIAVNTGVSFGNGIACRGVLPADSVTTSIDMDSFPDPVILVGGEVVINNISPLPADHLYSTSSGGTAIRLSITVQ